MRLYKNLINTKGITRNLILSVGVAFSFALALLPLQALHAATLTSASLSLSDSRPGNGGGTSVNYDFQASGVTTSSIRCIRMEFDTAVDGSGGKPTGLTLTGATFSGDYVPTPASWTVTNDNTNGVTTVTLAGGETPASASARNAILNGLTNGNTVDTGYYLLFNTYNNVDCSSSPVDSSIVQFIYTTGQTVSLSVDSSLSFSVAGASSGASCNGATSNVTTTSTTIPFGTVTTGTNRIGVQNLTVTTNSGNGYTTYARYTAKPTSGSNDIDDHSGTNGSPTAFSAAGTEAYGYTTNDSSLSTGPGAANRFTTTPNVWAAFTTSNAEVAFSTAAVSNQTTCVGQQVGVGGTTAAGSYTTTVIYTATPVY